MLAIERGHAGVLGVVAHLGVAGPHLFFARVLGDAQVVERVVGLGVHMLHVDHQFVANIVHAHLLTACEDLVAPMLFVPLGQRRGHVHLLDDVAPANARVVSAEADLAFLRGVGNDALLGAAEIVVEQILEPHAGDEQEVPAIGAALLDVVHGAVALDAAVVLAGGVEGLVHLLHHVGDLEVGRRHEWIVVAQQREAEAEDREKLAARGVVYLGQNFRNLAHVQEGRNRRSFLGFLVDHHGHADAAVRVASTAELAPLGGRPVYQIRPIGEGAHKADREPVALRLAEAHLVLDVMRHVRERVTLCDASLVADVFVAARKADRLEAEEADLPGIVERELDDAAHLLVVDAVDDRRHGNNVNAGFVQVVNGLQLYVEQVAHLAVRVGCVADAVELEVNVAEAGFSSSAAEFLALRKFNAVRCSLHRVVANLAAIGHGVKEVRRERGLAAAELYAHLPLGLDGDGVVQHQLDLVPGQLVDESYLVGIHEAGIAHHVAAIGEIDRQHRAATVGDGRGAVIVEILVAFPVGLDVAAGEALFKMLEEGRVDGHDVFKVAMLGAILHHQDLAVALDDLGLDFAHLLVEQNFMGQLAVQNLLADLRHALGAQRVRGARPSEGRLFLLPALQERLVAPLGDEPGVGADPVQALKHRPRALGRNKRLLFRRTSLLLA